MKEVSIALIPREEIPGRRTPGKGRTWKPVATEMRTFPLTIEGDGVSGEIELTGSPEKDVDYVYQTIIVRSDGTKTYSRPGLVRAEFSRTGKTSKDDDDDWIAEGEDEPEAQQIMLGETRMVDGAKITPLKVPAPNILSNLLFDAEGEHLYLVESGGVVRKIALPKFNLVRRSKVADVCRFASLSAAGLLVVTEKDDILVLDKDSLSVSRSVRVTGIVQVASSPKSSMAYANLRAPVERNKYIISNLAVVDTEQGRIVRKYETGKVWSKYAKRKPRIARQGTLDSCSYPAVSPDGKYFFCLGRYNGVYRFRISGSSLSLEFSGYPIYPGRRPIRISHNSKFVALYTYISGWRPPDHGELINGSTYIYKTSEQIKPIVGINAKLNKHTHVTIDTASNLIYGASEEGELLVHTNKGNKSKAIKLSDKSKEIREIALHPLGKKMLVHTGSELLWLELTENSFAKQTLSSEFGIPAESEEVLLGESRRVRGATITKLNFKDGASSEGLVWSSDGSTLYAYGRKGLLKKISVPEFKVEREIQFKRDCRGIAMSS